MEETRVEANAQIAWDGIAVGSVLADKYTIERELARGGMGIVYLAHQTGLHRKVAVKVIAPSLARTEDFVRRFRREAIALAQLRHGNIVSIHDFGEANGAMFLVMDYVPGPNLEEFASRYSPDGVPPEQALLFVEQLLSGLAHAHQRGIVHRDLKPANLLIEGDADLRITDFGLAQIRTELATAPSALSTEAARHGRTETIAGTYEFMAPEAHRSADADHRADIFSVGVIIYWLLCGSRPGPLAAPISRRAKNKGINSGWDRIVARALAESPDNRFTSAAEMLAEVRVLKGSKAPTTRRGDLPQREAGPNRDVQLLSKIRLIALVMVSAIFLGILLYSVSAWLMR